MRKTMLGMVLVIGACGGSHQASRAENAGGGAAAKPQVDEEIMAAFDGWTVDSDAPGGKMSIEEDSLGGKTSFAVDTLVCQGEGDSASCDAVWGDMPIHVDGTAAGRIVTALRDAQLCASGSCTASHLECQTAPVDPDTDLEKTTSCSFN
jgi:hypothetical protein